MKENAFQAKFIKTLKQEFHGCIVLKNDSSYIQGIPDLIILYKNMWAALECKRGANASYQPNQDYYIETMNYMSFAAVVYPENCEDILEALRNHFGKEVRRCLS